MPLVCVFKRTFVRPACARFRTYERGSFFWAWFLTPQTRAGKREFREISEAGGSVLKSTCELRRESVCGRRRMLRRNFLVKWKLIVGVQRVAGGIDQSRSDEESEVLHLASGFVKS